MPLTNNSQVKSTSSIIISNPISVASKVFCSTPPKSFKYSLSSLASKSLKSSAVALICYMFLVSINTQAIGSDAVLMNMNEFRLCINAIDTQAIDNELFIPKNKLSQCVNTNSINTYSTNTFDKAAYLDLNTEYNPATINKKDSQKDSKQDIFLKQVGGIVRNALGSTDSDNAGELVSKITTGIKSQLQTQAISTTEDIINDKANRLVNRFGSGRSEVSLHGLNSKELDYSIKTIQPISDLDANSKDLTFVQAQLSSDENSGDRRRTINLGVGHRMLVDDDMAIAGINMFHDYESKSAHERLSLGLEYNRSNFGISANTYHALSDKKTINNATEQALSGYDIRLTGQAPYLPWATIKGTNYFYDASVGNNIKGNVVGVEVELTPSISFEFGQQNDNNTNSQSYGKLNVKLPLGDNEQLTNFAIDDKTFKASSKMNLSDFAWVERDNKIQVEGVEQVEEVATSMTAYSITYRAITIG